MYANGFFIILLHFYWFSIDRISNLSCQINGNIINMADFNLESPLSTDFYDFAFGITFKTLCFGSGLIFLDNRFSGYFHTSFFDSGQVLKGEFIQCSMTVI